MFAADTLAPAPAENPDFTDVVPTLAGAVAAYGAVHDAYKDIAKECNAAELAVYALANESKSTIEAARAAVPVPAELMAPYDGRPYVRSMVFNTGEEVPIADGKEPSASRLLTERCVGAHVRGSLPEGSPEERDARAAPLLKALKAYNKARDAAEWKAVPGLRAAERKASALDKARTQAEEACHAARLAILAVPARTMEDALAKQRAFFDTLDADVTADGVVKPRKTRGAAFCLDALYDRDEDAAREALMRDIARLRTPPTAPDSDARSKLAERFQSARDTYEKAAAAYQEVADAHEAADDAARAETPPPAALVKRGPLGGEVGFYLTEASIQDDTKLPFQQRVEMLAALREWLPVRAAAEERHGVADLERKAGELGRAHVDAEEAVLALAPSSAADLAFQFKLAFAQYGTGVDPADPVMISETLSGDDNFALALVTMYQRALLLAGEHETPVARVTAFDPVAWVNTFEGATGQRIRWTGVDTDGTDSPELQKALALWGELRGWQKKLVKEFADDRFNLLDRISVRSKEPAWGMIELAQRAGGAFHVNSDGHLYLGRDLTERASALLRPLEDQLAAFPELVGEIIAELQNPQTDEVPAKGEAA